MILTLHNRELVLSFKDTKLGSCVLCYVQLETEPETCACVIYYL